jgi:glycosyltransferase involved in cell wall biosynthesis
MHPDAAVVDLYSYSRRDRGRARPCSIVHLVAPGAAGGLETVVHALATGHAALGHRVHVVGLDDDETTAAFLARFTGTSVATAVLGAHGRAYRRERRLVVELLSTLDPDLVHSHGNRADVIDAPAAVALGIPVVTTVHGFTGATLRNRLYGMLQRRAFGKFDAVVAVSRPLAEQLRRFVAPARLHLIANALPATARAVDRTTARHRLGVHDDRLLIGWVGRMSREKAPDVMITALSRLARLAPRMAMELAMVGDGPERSHLRELARREGVASFVRWHGVIPDAARLMRAFDLLVVSSHTEGTPMVVLEAMAARVPVVATAVGGIPDMVGAGGALLVRAGDPSALGAAMHSAICDREQTKARTHTALEMIATRHEPTAWLARYAELYESIRRDAGRET